MYNILYNVDIMEKLFCVPVRVHEYVSIRYGGYPNSTHFLVDHVTIESSILRPNCYRQYYPNF